MDLFKVATGLFWFVGGQAAFYFFSPVFMALMNAFTSAALGDAALPVSLEVINYGGFVIAYVACAWVLPIYFVSEGLTKG